MNITLEKILKQSRIISDTTTKTTTTETIITTKTITTSLKLPVISFTQLLQLTIMVMDLFLKIFQK